MAICRILLVTLFLVVRSFYCYAFTTRTATSSSSSSYRFLQSQQQQQLNLEQSTSVLFSSFFGKFEEFDDDDDDEEEGDEDDEEYEEMSDRDLAAFRSKMGNLFGDSEADSSSSSGGGSVDELISYARSQSGDDATDQKPADWARPCEPTNLKPGIILVANPEKFCGTSNDEKGGLGGLLSSAVGGGQPSPSLLAKFGLTRPPPKDLGPDRQADLLPVLALVELDDKRGARGVLLNRRTGYLLGDLEQPPPNLEGTAQAQSVGPILEKFCIQPLWFGGIDNVSSGLDMLHQCPAVSGATKLTDDGLFWGGDPAQAQDAMEDPSLDKVMTGFDFKFFVQSTIWSSKDLEKEVKDGIWFPAEVSKDVLFKSRDRMGTQKAMPLWTEIMELMGGEFQDVKDSFYDEKNEDPS